MCIDYTLWCALRVSTLVPFILLQNYGDGGGNDSNLEQVKPEGQERDSEDGMVSVCAVG